MVLFAAFSCTKEEEVKSFDPPLVVEGWIESGECPIVQITSGIEATPKYRRVSDLGNVALRYAEVSIEHDGETFRLSSRISDEYTLMNYYTTGELKGEVGGVYRLTVKWNGKTATSTTTIPEPHQIDRLSANPSIMSGNNFTLVASISDDGSEPRYYKFFTRVKGDTLGYKSSLFGTFSNENRTGAFDITIHNGVNYIKHKQTVFFERGDTVSVKLATMEEGLFSFWRKYDQNCLCASLPVVSFYDNVKGNVDGALGYWAGYGITEREICIE